MRTKRWVETARGRGNMTKKERQTQYLSFTSSFLWLCKKKGAIQWRCSMRQVFSFNKEVAMEHWVDYNSPLITSCHVLGGTWCGQVDMKTEATKDVVIQLRWRYKWTKHSTEWQNCQFESCLLPLESWRNMTRSVHWARSVSTVHNIKQEFF